MVLETKNLTKQFNKKGGFKDVSLSINEGEVFSFLGKNGAGKSTFVRTVLGLLNKDSGEGAILSQPIGSIESRRLVGYLPELFQYQSWLSGYELLKVHAELSKMDKSKIHSRICDVLEIVGLAGHEKKKLKEYSKGMKQRIGLGCAIIADPVLLFLDEPTSALDPIGRKQVRDIIMHLKGQGKTIFLNTHLLSEAELISDRVSILDKGTVKKTGTMDELLFSPLILTVENMSDDMISALRRFDPGLSIDRNQITLNVADEGDYPSVAREIINRKGLLYSMKKQENSLERIFIDTVGEDDSR